MIFPVLLRIGRPENVPGAVAWSAHPIAIESRVGVGRRDVRDSALGHN